MIGDEVDAGAGAGAASRASLPRRLVAFGVDYLVIAVYIVALWLISTGVAALGLVPAGAFADPVRGQLIGFGLLTLPVVLYFALWEGSSRGATPGKRAAGLRVVAAGGAQLPWGRSLLRSALKFVPWELAHACLWRIPGWPGPAEAIPTGVALGLGVVWLLVASYLLMPIVSRSRQTPYDRVAGTSVVRLPRASPSPA